MPLPSIYSTGPNHPGPDSPSSKINWPPRSPREAFSNSPSRRKRLEHLRASQRSISPSPTPVEPSRQEPINPSSDDDIPGADDEDEETIQLRIAELQAQLKLKKLRKAKASKGRQDGSRDHPADVGKKQENIWPDRRDKRTEKHHKYADAREEHVQVPHSPKRRVEAIKPDSPRRVQLGIDKGLKAKDVSLKSSRSMIKDRGEGSRGALDQAKTKSFSEKLVDAREQAVKREEKQKKIDGRKTCGFGVDGASVVRPQKDLGEAFEQRAQPARDDRSNLRSPNRTSRHDNNHQFKKPSICNIEQYQPSQASADSKAHETDPHTHFRLSKRHIPHSTITTAVSEKALYPLPRLLKEVTAPDYDPPDPTEEDIVVFGIIASKSSPYDHAPQNKTTSTDSNTGEDNTSSQKSKFMVFHLTDLTWELDLFLFGTAFNTFYQLPVGSVIAVLNPGIMPPKTTTTSNSARYNGRFSLKLASSEDTVVNIGTSADLGFCKSIKKDGKECMAWIDSRKTDFCEFHVNLQVERSKAGRMEINGMGSLRSFLGAPEASKRNSQRDGSSRWKARGGFGFFGGWSRGAKGGESDRGNKQGQYYDREAHASAYMLPPEFQTSGALSARKLLDAEDLGPDGHLSAAERSRKKLAAIEKERDLARKLSERGGGMGAGYMKQKEGGKDDGDGKRDRKRDKQDENADRDRGVDYDELFTRKSQHVTLSPVKGRRVQPEPMGWKGATKRPLGSPTRDPEQGGDMDRAKRARYGCNALVAARAEKFPTLDKIVKANRTKEDAAPKPRGVFFENHERNDDNDDDDDDGLDII